MMKEWKDAMTKAKKESFAERLEELNMNPSTKKAWRFIKSVMGTNRKSSRNPWNSEHDLNLLAHLKSQVPNVTETYIDIAQCDTFYGFSFDEFGEVFKNKNKSSAAGTDGITYSMMRALSEPSQRAILTAMNNTRHFQTK